MSIFIRSLLILLSLYSFFAHADEIPKLPFIDDGACPFEGCIYRTWKSTKKVIAFKEAKDNSSVAFEVNKDEEIIAITGFVITTKIGITKIIKPIKIGYLYNSYYNKGELNLKPGDLIYTLHYVGEGYDLFWYKGKLYTDQISGDPTQNPLPDWSLHVISAPDYDWWVKVKNKSGEIGWIKNPSDFEGTDQFG